MHQPASLSVNAAQSATTTHAGVRATCIMPTANRREMVPDAIACFLRQDYAERELLIIDDGTDAIHDLVPPDPRIQYFRIPAGLTLGAKRNRACELARGAIIVHWDDDDWYPPDRISRQVQALLATDRDVCGSSRVYYRDAARGLAWEYAYNRTGRPWVAGNTLAYRRALWERNRFRAIQVGEDSHFVWSAAPGRIADLDDPGLCVASIHGSNTSRKRTGSPLWRSVEPALLERVMTVAGQQYGSRAAAIASDGERRGANVQRTRGSALVAVAAGIGDVIRTTPLIRALYRLGYEVDVLSAADYPQTADLLAGAPEVRRVITVPGLRANRRRSTSPDLSSAEYDVACFTYWARPLEQHVRARTRQRFDKQSWLTDGDSSAVERMARALGWQEEMPSPFVVPAKRGFNLPPGTVAIHAGCKKGWPWKKWHGFADVAERLEHVVLIGTAEDMDAAGTYFGKPFEWPAHVHSYIDRLTLPETAALIQQCAALVCNDSGMQHIGAAVGTPTYAVYGITNPERELIPISTVRAVTKGLACETECRRQPWGRRDCHRHLECLKTMTASEILERIQRDGIVLPARSKQSEPRHSFAEVPAETLKVAVRIDGGIGDILLASPWIEALFDELNRCEIDVFYHHPEAAKFIFCNARFVRAVHGTQQLNRLERQYELSLKAPYFIRYTVSNAAKLQRVSPDFAERLKAVVRRFESYKGFAARQPLLDGLWGRMSVRDGRNVLDSIGFLSGVEVSRDSPFFLAPDPAGHHALESHLGGYGQRFITLHDGFDNTAPIAAGAATKCWPLEHWQALTAELKQRYPDTRLVQVGARKSRRIPGVDVNLVDRTTLHESAWIIKNALVHIDTDSGLVHLARALHTPAIVLFGPTDPGYHGHACNTNIAPAACGNCWWSTPDWLARCPRGLASPECMESIRPEVVLTHAVQRLSQLRPVAAIAGAVTCYESLDEPGRSALRRMCEALDLPIRPIAQHIKNDVSGVYIHASKQWEYVHALKALANAFAPDPGALRVADLGGGRGALAPWLAREGHNVEVFDLDYAWDDGGDPAVELRYRMWAKSIGFRARHGSLYNVPANSNSYDAVTCISVVEHVPYKEYVLKEALRILRPGGLLILTFDFANSPERFEDRMRREIFSPERLRATMERIGIAFSPPDHDEVERSARQIQADGVCGIPNGMTVAALVIRKASQLGAIAE